MKPLVLRAHIRPLPEYLPRTRAMEEAIGVGAGFDGAWYRSQKEHWLSWLSEYDGPGAYARSSKSPRTAAYAYNHIQCAPMLFWLAEALGVPESRLMLGIDAVVAIPNRGAPQCAALRQSIPWLEIENRLAAWSFGFVDRVHIRSAGVFR